MTKQIKYHTESYYDDGSDSYLVASLSFTAGKALITFQCQPSSRADGERIIIDDVKDAITTLQN